MKCQMVVDEFGVDFHFKFQEFQKEVWFSFNELDKKAVVYIPETTQQQYSYKTVSRRLKLRIW